MNRRADSGNRLLRQLGGVHNNVAPGSGRGRRQKRGRGRGRGRGGFDARDSRGGHEAGGAAAAAGGGADDADEGGDGVCGSNAASVAAADAEALARLPVPLQRMVTAAAKRSVRLMIMPPGMERRKTNTSRFHQQQDVFFWRVNWLFDSRHLGEPDSSDVSRAPPGPSPLEAYRLVDEQLSETTTLEDAVAKFLEPRAGTANAASRHALKHYACLLASLRAAGEIAGGAPPEARCEAQPLPAAVAAEAAAVAGGSSSGCKNDSTRGSDGHGGDNSGRYPFAYFLQLEAVTQGQVNTWRDREWARESRRAANPSSRPQPSVHTLFLRACYTPFCPPAPKIRLLSHDFAAPSRMQPLAEP